MGVGGVAAGVELEDIVHHRQAEAPHHLAVEEQVSVIEAVAQPVEVLQQDFRLPVVDLDDGVLVEADAAPDAVVVRRQQSLQVLVVGGGYVDCLCIIDNMFTIASLPHGTYTFIFKECGYENHRQEYTI